MVKCNLFSIVKIKELGSTYTPLFFPSLEWQFFSLIISFSLIKKSFFHILFVIFSGYSTIVPCLLPPSIFFSLLEPYWCLEYYYCFIYMTNINAFKNYLSSCCCIWEDVPNIRVSYFRDPGVTKYKPSFVVLDFLPVPLLFHSRF